MPRSFLRSIALGLVAPLSLAAQASVSVPIKDPVYRDLDRVIGSGLVETALVGQRPYSRREIARIIADASRLPPRRAVNESTRRILARLQHAFAADLEALEQQGVAPDRGVLDSWSVMALTLDSPRRSIPQDLLGSVAADINPILNGRAARRFENGTTMAIETEHSMHLGANVALRVSPRLAAGTGAGRPFVDAGVTALSGTFQFRNIAIEAGRQPWVWGQGMSGGLIASSSGPPLDMIRVTSDLPFRAPWIFRRLGLLRGMALVADLGNKQTFPHSKLFAYRLGGQVTPWFELASYVVGELGGEGAPGATVLDYVVDLIPPLKYSLRHKNRSQFSNKFSGVETRFRIPSLSGLQLYTETGFDDADPRRWRSTFWEDGGHILGFSLEQLGPENGLSTAAEFHHTGLRFYKHTPFTTGLALNRTLFGDPLGNQGDGGYWRLSWDNGARQSWRIDAAAERRRGDEYSTTSDGPNEDNFRFVLMRSLPPEWRYRVVVAWSRTSARRAIALEAGGERVTNFAFVAGATRYNALASVSLRSVP